MIKTEAGVVIGRQYIAQSPVIKRVSAALRRFDQWSLLNTWEQAYVRQQIYKARAVELLERDALSVERIFDRAGIA